MMSRRLFLKAAVALGLAPSIPLPTAPRFAGLLVFLDAAGTVLAQVDMLTTGRRWYGADPSACASGRPRSFRWAMPDGTTIVGTAGEPGTDLEFDRPVVLGSHVAVDCTIRVL